MKFTNNTIATTKHNALRVILTNMKPQIQKGIDMVARQEVAMNIERNPNYKVSEFAYECIEMGLLFDLYKSVVSYTNPSDEVKEFESGYSIKGNFELSGIIVRDGEEYGFICEAIIADGAINRRHVRYITRTSLPKNNMEEANKIKLIIKKNNKINSIQRYIDNLIGYKADSMKSYEDGMKLTREDHKQILIDKGDWLFGDNWEDLYSEGWTKARGWDTKQDYLNWIGEANEGSIASRIEHIESALDRANRLDKSISKEVIKLNKAKAL